MSGVGAPQEKDRKEVDVGMEMLVESPELSIRDPAHSMVGLALQGLMATQTEEGVGVASRGVEHNFIPMHASSPLPPLVSAQ